MSIAFRWSILIDWARRECKYPGNLSLQFRNLRSGVPYFLLRREGTPDTITWIFVCRPLIKISVSANVGDAISRKIKQNYRKSCVLSTDRIEIHQSQPLVWPSDLLCVMLAGCDWWISIRSVDNMYDWRKCWKRFRGSRINENGDNTYIALLPNPVGSTAKTSLPWHAILRMHSICSSLRVLWTKLWREAFKADKNSLSSLASSDVMMEFISSREFFNGNHTATKVTNHGSVLSTFLFLDQSEKSSDSGLATDKYSSNCIRRTFPPRQKL